MFSIQFTPRGERDFQKLPRGVQAFVREKLAFYAAQEQPLRWAKPLVNLPPATHRFRIRTYRAYFFIEQGTIFIERIQPRGNAYRE